MGRMGDGYGSEYHLQQYVNDYPDLLGALALEAMGRRGRIKWLPRVPAVTRPDKLVEWKGLSK